MLEFVSEPMPVGAVAALYDDGHGNTILMLNEAITDPELRCDVVNGLLARLAATPLASLSSQVA